MNRQSARYTHFPPGEAIVRTRNGKVFTSGRITSPIMTIVDAAEHVDGRVKIKVAGEPGFLPGHTLHTRIDGQNGVTDRAHPGLGDNLPVEDLGGGWAALTGTQWVAGSVFRSGRCWHSPVSLLRADLIWQELVNEVWRVGGGEIELPWTGAIAGRGTFWFREHVNVKGHGDSCGFFAMDGANAHFMRAITGDFTAEYITGYGNRQKQDPTKGFHGFRLGIDGEIANVKLLRIKMLAAAGYGHGWQGDGSFVNCELSGEVDGCESDGVDGKNREDKSGGNRVSLIVRNFGLRKIGLDYPGKTLPTDPFTMTAGSEIVSVSSPANGYSAGIKVTLNGGTVRGVNMTGTFTILNKIQNGYRITANEQASSSGAGGGSGVLEYASQFSEGDAGIDLRGKGWDVPLARIISDMRTRVGLRFRSGGSLTPNGVGGVYCNAGSVFVTNTHSNRSNSNGLGIAGKGINVGLFQGENLRRAVYFQVQSSRCAVVAAEVHDCDMGADIRGNYNKLGITADTCETGVVVLGGTVVDRDYLPADAFSTIQGSNVVTVNLPGHLHTTGDLVEFMFAEPFNNVDPNGSGLSITVINANYFSYVTTTTADATGAGGGENATYSFGLTQSGAGHVVDKPITLGCTTGISIGTGATKTKLIVRQSFGDTTDLVDLGSDTVDLGS